MRKSHIIAITIIALSIGAIVGSFADSSTYANFNEAFSNPGNEYHVVGKLNKEKDVHYDPGSNTSLVKFHMIDKKGIEKKVYLHRSKPQDFERAENIVLIGEAKDSTFHANDILMKCPSKYNDQAKVAHSSSKE
ncbi:MAG: cytochrome c maturation protein CcmE [Flavobacteriales bacterium]